MHQNLVFDTAGSIGCKLDIFIGIERIDGFNQANGSYRNQIVQIDAGIIEPAGYVYDKAQIVLYERAFHAFIALVHALDQRIFLFLFEGRRQSVVRADIVKYVGA